MSGSSDLRVQHAGRVGNRRNLGGWTNFLRGYNERAVPDEQASLPAETEDPALWVEPWEERSKARDRGWETPKVVLEMPDGNWASASGQLGEVRDLTVLIRLLGAYARAYGSS